MVIKFHEGYFKKIVHLRKQAGGIKVFSMQDTL